jgi:hypothetical protein
VVKKNAADIAAEAGSIGDQKIMDLPGFLMAHRIEGKRMQVIDLSSARRAK